MGQRPLGHSRPSRWTNPGYRTRRARMRRHRPHGRGQKIGWSDGNESLPLSPAAKHANAQACVVSELGRKAWPAPRGLRWVPRWGRWGQARYAVRFAEASSCTSGGARCIPADASRCGHKRHSKIAGSEPGYGSPLPDYTNPPCATSCHAPKAHWRHSVDRPAADTGQASEQ